MVEILSDIKDILVSPADNANIIDTVIYPNSPNLTPTFPFNWNDCIFNLSLGGLQSCAFFQNEIGTFDNNGEPLTIVNIIKMNNYNQYKNRCKTWLH